MIATFLALTLSTVPADAPLRDVALTQVASEQVEVHSSTVPEVQMAKPGLHTARRVMQIVTLGLLGAAATAGTIAAINQPTAFGPGRCATGNPVFGSYGCDGFSILHGAGGVVAVSSYTAAEVLGVVDRAYNPRPRSALNRGFFITHLTAMVLQPALGLVGAYPQVVGVAPQSRPEFSSALRTVHVGVGVVLALAYLGAILTE